MLPARYDDDDDDDDEFHLSHLPLCGPGPFHRTLHMSVLLSDIFDI